ncbi:hypothetical protein SPHG1_28 [Salmonella phage SPHG1]|uniref:Uncharacterized protein n=1 Tax=Salmonella phage vB_SenM-1 TaxID=2732255 RepID=A0A6M4BEL9_9CAUD|nr:hypothetical protein vBSenM1_46 [Salmonella phage vB_SenM-1]QQO39149.1 hypothetical protein SPHG1_28 [Salmonella phage SPHG1]
MPNTIINEAPLKIFYIFRELCRHSLKSGVLSRLHALSLM